jgi:hypothetical protein
MTNAGLHREFLLLNERFFNGRVSVKKLAFSSRQLPSHAAGAFYQEDQEILISAGLREYQNQVVIILLHEMVHADLYARGYVGYPCDGGHGCQFQVEMDRLYRAGSYDGLL